MDCWHTELDDSLPEAQEAFTSLESVWELRGESVTNSSLCSVDRVELDGRGYYVKRYRRGGEGLAEFIGISKARTEWQNLQRFRQWQLPAAKVVAWGEDPWWKLPRRGVVITAEIEGSVDLASLASRNSALFSNPDWVQSVSEQVANATSVMHSHGFAHNDWKWRNILVAGSEQEPRIHMIDCPAGTFWWGPFFEYRRIKDVACLDKIGRKMLTEAQRREFYRLYRDVPQLSVRDEQDLKKITRFFKGRE